MGYDVPEMKTFAVKNKDSKMEVVWWSEGRAMFSGIREAGGWSERGEGRCCDHGFGLVLGVLMGAEEYYGCCGEKVGKSMGCTIDMYQALAK